MSKSEEVRGSELRGRETKRIRGLRMREGEGERENEG